MTLGYAILVDLVTRELGWAKDNVVRSRILLESIFLRPKLSAAHADFISVVKQTGFKKRASTCNLFNSTSWSSTPLADKQAPMSATRDL